MIIGVLQVEVLIDGSQSLKDKRRVVKSIKDSVAGRAASFEEHVMILRPVLFPICES